MHSSFFSSQIYSETVLETKGFYLQHIRGNVGMVGEDLWYGTFLACLKMNEIQSVVWFYEGRMNTIRHILMIMV